LLWSLVLLALTGRARAHDLAIDQLTLWPEPAQGRIRGQVLCDPELTRPRGAAVDEAVRARVVRFLRTNLRLEVDGVSPELSFEVRELWTGDGAIQGDSVMLRAVLPSAPGELRVSIGSPLRVLAVSVEMPDARGSLVPRTTLVLGGHSTPPFRFAAPDPGERWLHGGPDALAVEGLRHGTARVARAAPSGALPRTPAEVTPGFVEESAGRVGLRYLVLGIEHILPWGFDHVLFVAGLVLGSWGRRPRLLLLELAGFTVAHTVTLGLGALGLVLVPARVIEPLIALSIAFVGIQNLWSRGAPKHRLPWVLAFGLLHGQGFAASLIATGIPSGSLVLSLLAFNVGVELGQLLVVGGLLLLLRPLRDADRFRRFALFPGSAMIAGAGIVWTVGRLL
jgi:hypothetical protein